MAMIDYGTILVRDGIIQNRDQMFMEKTDLGFDIPDKLVFRGDPDRVAFIDGDFFAYTGDMDFMLCFYKYRVLVISNGVYVGDGAVYFLYRFWHCWVKRGARNY